MSHVTNSDAPTALDEEQYNPPYNMLMECTEEEAKRRAKFFRDKDPFPEIQPALLSSEHIRHYVRVTGMLWPFDDNQQRLKSASYEVEPGGKFIFWDEHGRKQITDIKAGEGYKLRANSITFMQIKPTIRLPNYIALRFNLRIKHVHRGLLLGTGPLVDPGFSGNLLIPLHNLTSDDYEISGDEGLIWIEFTKTSHLQVKNLANTEVNSSFNPIEKRKLNTSPEYYFEKASRNNPIRSSIPIAVNESREKASQAEKSARRAQRTVQVLAGIGVLAVGGAVLALLSYFAQVNANVTASTALADSIRRDLATTSQDASAALRQEEALRLDLESAIQRIDVLERLIQQLSQTNPQTDSPPTPNP